MTDIAHRAKQAAPEGAGVMKAWCPNCTRRTKADAATWDTNGEDYWWCDAWPIVPAFTGGHRNGMARPGPSNDHWGEPINLKHFEPGTTYHAGLSAKDCPLFEPPADRGRG